MNGTEKKGFLIVFLNEKNKGGNVHEETGFK